MLETIRPVLSSKLDTKLNICAVTPSFIQEVEKKAYLMINAYGKIEAEKVAVGYAKRMDDRKWYWLAVASAIKNWV